MKLKATAEISKLTKTPKTNMMECLNKAYIAVSSEFPLAIIARKNKETPKDIMPMNLAGWNFIPVFYDGRGF